MTTGRPASPRLAQRADDDLAWNVVSRGGGLNNGGLADARIAPQAHGDTGATGGAQHGDRAVLLTAGVHLRRTQYRSRDGVIGCSWCSGFKMQTS